MTFNDETLMAYADGELDAPTRAAVEAAMAADPRLAAQIERHRALRVRLRAALDPVLAEPPPQRLLDSARGVAPRRTDSVVSLRRGASARGSRWQWTAMAASLVVGALLGPLLVRAPAGGAIIARDGQLLAGATLARALSEQLASAQPPGAPVQIGVSFRSRSGDYCRTFVLHEAASFAGLACRGTREWRLEALAQAPAPAAAGAYRQAASALPPGISHTLDELIAGEPLSAAAESAARARGWQP
jgi:hypothetical protein